MEKDLDVSDCLRRWRKGDEGAAESLILYLYPIISKIVRTHLPRRDQEEDLVQEVLMKTFARLPQYRAEAPFDHWVMRVALTTCLDRLRAQKIRPELRRADLTPAEAEIFDLTWMEGSTPDAGNAIQARDLVDRLLETLSGPDRSLILMVDLEGRSLEEIASITGWGLSKIKMRLLRLRSQLRQTIETLEGK